MESRKLETRGGRTKVRVYEGGTGETLVFLHGAGGLIQDDPFLEGLAQRYRVVAPLLPGYEDSEGEESIHDMLAITLHSFDVLDALEIRKPILVGHSMGGMLAAEMAALCPHEIDKLALIAPAGLWLEANPIPDLFSLLPMELPALLFHDVAKGGALMSAGANFEDDEFLKEFMVANSRRLGTAGKMLFPIPNRRLCDRIYRITAQTVLIWGQNDQFIDPVYGAKFREYLPQADWVEIEAAGHMVPYEQTDAVLEGISRLG